MKKKYLKKKLFLYFRTKGEGIVDMFLNLAHKLFGQNINKDKDNFPTVNPINERLMQLMILLQKNQEKKII